MLKNLLRHLGWVISLTCLFAFISALPHVPRVWAETDSPAWEVSSPSAITTTTTLTSTVNPALVGQPVTLTALISPSLATGTVQFYADRVAFGLPQAVTGGAATLVTTTLRATVHPITATYSGDANFMASTSALLVQGVYTRLAVAAGINHTCGLKADGTLACWGYNNNGQTTVPSPNTNWLHVSAGRAHTCGLKGDGTLACWGFNSNGQTTVPSPNMDWLHVSAGYDHTCGLKADGMLRCWGNNDYGQTTVPSPNTNWVQVSAGGYHTCGLKADGTLACWGRNEHEQTTVPSPNTNWVPVSAGGYHTCGLKADGTLRCWGWNIEGQTAVPSPNTNWVQVSASHAHTCGLKADGTLRCWGYNSNGQTTVPSPNTNWVQVSVGRAHTCGLKDDDTLRCWGSNDSGQAPQVTLTPANLPHAVLGAIYTQTIVPTGTLGATPPFTLAVISGTLPPGLTLNAAGTWSGAPTAVGAFIFTVQARDANNIAGTQAYTLTVDMADTTTTLVASSNPSTFGQSVTFTAAVTSTAGTPSGNVTFTLDAANSVQPLVNGVATYVTNTLGLGVHPVTVTYSGDENYDTSSATLSGGQIVNDAPITNLQALNSSPTRIGNTTAFTATLSAGSNVTFTWNFGDGQTAGGAQATHRYTQTRTYTATVTATNNVGSVNAITQVTIQPYQVFMPLIRRS